MIVYFLSGGPRVLIVTPNFNTWLAVPRYPARVLTPSHTLKSVQTKGSVVVFWFAAQHDNSKKPRTDCNGPAERCTAFVTFSHNFTSFLRASMMWILMCTRFASGCGELEHVHAVRVDAHIATLWRVAAGHGPPHHIPSWLVLGP
jgi:hypothetical protein